MTYFSPVTRAKTFYAVGMSFMQTWYALISNSLCLKVAGMWTTRVGFRLLTVLIHGVFSFEALAYVYYNRYAFYDVN